MANLYLGNFPYETTEEELKKLLEEFGRVESIKIIHDHATGKSKGFGFATMEQHEADRAIEELHRKRDLKGRLIVVAPAHGN